MLNSESCSRIQIEYFSTKSCSFLVHPRCEYDFPPTTSAVVRVLSVNENVRNFVCSAG